MTYEWDYKKIANQSIREELRRTVCEEFNVSYEELKSCKAKRKFIDARSAYVFILRKHFTDTCQAIGIELGRHHASIIYMVKRVEDKIFIKDHIAKQIERIEKKLFNQL